MGKLALFWAVHTSTVYVYTMIYMTKILLDRVFPGGHVRLEAPRRALRRRQPRHGAALLHHGGPGGQVDREDEDDRDGGLRGLGPKEPHRGEDEDPGSPLGQRHQGEVLELGLILESYFHF